MPPSSLDPVEIAVSCRILGALFYLPPNTPTVTPFFQLIEQGHLPQIWPFGTEELLEKIQMLMQQNTNATALTQAHQALFIGPHHLDAPPWGSVYLEEEGTLCGGSTLALRAFLQTEHIELELTSNEPEDHIGLLFWAMALLAEQQKMAAFRTLLNQHVLTWSDRYLAQFEQTAEHPFYRGLGQLAKLTLDNIQTGINVPASSGA